MVTRRKSKLVPRSFLPTEALNTVLSKEADRRGMKISQLIRNALVEWALYNGIREAQKARREGKL